MWKRAGWQTELGFRLATIFLWFRKEKQQKKCRAKAGQAAPAAAGLGDERQPNRPFRPG
jgi:hypothetical protein